MNEGQQPKSASRWRWWLKVLIGSVVLMAIAVTVVLLNIDPIAHHLANRALARFLPAGGMLDDVDIHLGDASAELTGITIRAPKGFGDDPLLAVGALVVDVDPLALAKGEIVVERLTVRNLSLVLVRDKNGHLSPLELLTPAEATSREADADEAPGKPDRPALPSIRVNEIRLEKVAVRVIDHLAGGDWHARVGIDMSTDDLRIKDLLKRNIQLGRLNLSVHDVVVDQPAGFSRSPLLTMDRCQVVVSGVDLTTSRLPVDRLMVEGLTASVERAGDGTINIQRLVDAWIPLVSQAGKPASKENTVATPTTDDEPAATAIPTLLLKTIQVKSVAFQVLDEIDGDPWRAGFNRLDVGITELTVGDITRKAVSLGSFALDLKGVAVDQPPGFGTDKLAGLEQVSVRTGALDLASPELAVNSITVTAPAAAVVVNADGMSNLQKLKASLMGDAKPSAEPSVDGPKPANSPKDGTDALKTLPVVRFDKIQVANGSLHYSNSAISKEGLALPLNNANLSVTRLSLFDRDTKTEPASVDGSIDLQQPGKLPTTRFGIAAVVGPITPEPLVNAQLRCVGFKLDTLGSLVPPATRTALGATGLDASAAMALNKRAINLFAAILTDRGVEYEALSVHGTVDHPTIKLADILSGAFDRISDGLFNLGGDSLRAGFSIAKGGVSAIGEVGKGVWGMGKNLEESALSIGKGILTLDGGDLRSGLTGVSKGTLHLAADSVKGTGGAVGSGLSGSVSNLKGDDRVRAWDMGISERYNIVMEQARESLGKMPYPPLVE